MHIEGGAIEDSKGSFAFDAVDFSPKLLEDNKKKVGGFHPS